MSAALRRCVLVGNDQRAFFGAARAFYSHGAWERFDPERLMETIAPITFTGLQHPRRENRRMILRARARIPGGEDVLLVVLEGEIEPLPLPLEEALAMIERGGVGKEE